MKENPKSAQDTDVTIYKKGNLKSAQDTNVTIQ